MSIEYLTELGSTSPANPAHRSREVEIYDVTLRDGEQQAGVVFSVAQKIELFERIEALGTPLIETGMIAVSPDESEVVRHLVSRPRRAKVYVLARAMAGDVEMAADAGAHGVTIEIVANPGVSSRILGWPEGAAEVKAQTAITAAHARGLEVNLFLVDATRVEPDRLADFVYTIVQNDAPARLTIADTFGVCSPEGMSRYVEALRSRVDIPLHVHCHNEFGLAVANSLAALVSGAAGAHVAVNGIGERAGNAAFEEVVLACLGPYGFDPGIAIEGIRELSRRVCDYSGFSVAANKAVVGTRLFTIESGIAATFYEALRDGELGHFYAYRPDVLAAEVDLELGKGSGISSIRMKLQEHHLAAEDYDLDKLLDTVKNDGARLQRSLGDEEFLALAADQNV